MYLRLYSFLRSSVMRYLLIVIFNITAGRSIAAATNTIVVNCDPLGDASTCHISEPIHIDASDRLKFSLQSNAEHILQLSITYEATIPLIPHSVFEQFPNLEQLTMATGIRSVHFDDFEHARSLRNLTLSDNKLEHIRQGDFTRAQNLIQLNLDGNEILHLDNDAFSGLNNLLYLSLNKNRLITLKSYAFSGAPHLTDLRLANNEIEALEPSVFDLPDLLFLYLAHNQLKTIPDECFCNTQLIGLDLRSNQLTHIGKSVYKLKSLKKLLLTDNRSIDDFNATRLREMKNFIELEFD